MKKRSYKQNCALALAADVVGERWSLLLVRDLLVGPRRFKELVASLRGMGSNLLATRLRDLEAADIVMRVAAGPGTHAYRLTGRGRALEPAVLALVRWGLNYGPENQPGFHHREEWDLVALKSLFQPLRAANLSLIVQFRSSDFAGWTCVREQRLSIGQGEAKAADIVVNATIKQLFTGPDAPESLLESGSAELLRLYMSAFVLRA